MNLKQIAAIAKKFGVQLGQNPSAKQSYKQEGVLIFYEDGETIVGVYFSPTNKLVRLRRPGEEWAAGDYADAIAMALTRRHPHNKRLANMIRSVGSIIQA